MLENDVTVATKRTVAIASETQSYSRGKRSRNEQHDSERDERSKPEVVSLDLSVSRREGGDPDDSPSKNGKLLRPN